MRARAWVRVFYRLFCCLMLLGSAGRGGGAWAGEQPVQGGPGGGPYRITCLSGSYARGVTVRSGAWIDAIQLNCAGFDPVDYQLTVAAAPTAVTGGNGGGQQVATCPAAYYVSGVKYGFTRDGNKPKYLDYVQIKCFPISGAPDLPPICLSTGAGNCWDRHPDPGPYNGYGLAFEESCPIDQAVMGLQGRSGAFVDAVGIVCIPRPMDPKTLPNKKASIRSAISQTQSGPQACVFGSGFDPGGSVSTTYVGVPGRLYGNGLPPSNVDPQGGFKTVNPSYDPIANCGAPTGPQPPVIVISTEKDRSGRVVASATAKLPAQFWCGTSAGAVNGGCGPERFR